MVSFLCYAQILYRLSWCFIVFDDLGQSIGKRVRFPPPPPITQTTPDHQRPSQTLVIQGVKANFFSFDAVFHGLLLAQKSPKKCPKFRKKYPISAQKFGVT
ncbi:hypothetical protein C3926_00710 [Legionella pneumophila]|nr:hypothetical protein lpt_00860 [Legionella pneumophila subsp. pneumophila]PQM73280.1 hypothetical protein C3926_00710 [Legionella pneumophila]